MFFFQNNFTTFFISYTIAIFSWQTHCVQFVELSVMYKFSGFFSNWLAHLRLSYVATLFLNATLEWYWIFLLIPDCSRNVLRYFIFVIWYTLVPQFPLIRQADLNSHISLALEDDLTNQNPTLSGKGMYSTVFCMVWSIIFISRSLVAR